MIVLDTTTRKIEVLLGGAVTTNQLPIVAVYVDMAYANSLPTTLVPASANAATNGATPVTGVAAPAASTVRNIKALTIQNADTVAAVVTVRLNDNGTTRNLVVHSLTAGQTLHYEDGMGWQAF